MFRIYTGPDGRPAAYSKENIPLKPKHHLPVSLKGVKDGDFAMIMGFPGTTDRFATSYSLQNTMDVVNDIRYKVRTEKLRIMKEEMDKSPETRIQYASKYASCANYWKYSNEQNKALRQLNTLGNKQDIESRFTAWVNADPARKTVYGEVLPGLQKAYGDIRDYAVARNYAMEALGGPEAHLFAYGVSGQLQALCSKETAPEEKAEIRQSLKEAAKAFYKDYNARLDARLFASLFRIYNERVGEDLHPAIIDRINKKYKGDYEKFAGEMLRTSVFMDEKTFNAFVDRPDCKKLHKDLAYLAGNSFYEIWIKLAAYTNEMNENIVKNNRLFVRGLMEMEPGKAMAPNANSTLRLTYGKVKSYKPRDAVFYDYYTTLTGVIEKEGPAGGEFEVPEKLKQLYAAGNFGSYGDKNIVTCFITDNDITGGNSGSAVINADGELIGAAFDGNSEAMSGDIDFEENLQRCINVDIRYVLFIIDKYAGARNLIEEMTLVK